MTTTTDLAARYLALARRLSYKCEACDGTGRDMADTVLLCPSPACAGTGKVYPLLVACVGFDPYHTAFSKEHSTACDCGGTGTVPKPPHIETLISAGALCGWRVEIQGGYPCFVIVRSIELPARPHYAKYNPTDEPSILGAVVDAVAEVVG